MSTTVSTFLQIRHVTSHILQVQETDGEREREMHNAYIHTYIHTYIRGHHCNRTHRLHDQI